MKILSYLFICMFTGSMIGAAELKYKYQDYDTAKKAESFVKFELTSTKVGLVTTSFDGYILSSALNFKRNGNEVLLTEFVADANSFDTDSGMRDSKLHDSILETGKYPEMRLKFPSTFLLDNFPEKVDGDLLIRGKRKTISVSVKLSESGGNYVVEGTALTGIKELELPDPSIFIAKVNDPIKISFRFVIPFTQAE